MAKSQVKGSKAAKKKPPSQHGNGGSIIVFSHRRRWRLCRDSRTKRNSAAQCDTQTCRSEPYRLIPTLSRSFAVASFQLGLVWSSASTVLPPNPAACLRVGVWDKSRDKPANYFETESPQFRFCPGDKNGRVLRLETARNGAKRADFPLWRLFSEVNRSQRLCRLAFPQVR